MFSTLKYIEIKIYIKFSYDSEKLRTIRFRQETDNFKQLFVILSNCCKNSSFNHISSMLIKDFSTLT